MTYESLALSERRAKSAISWLHHASEDLQWLQDRARLYLKIMCLIDVSFRVIGMVMHLIGLGSGIYQRHMALIWVARIVSLGLIVCWWLAARRPLTRRQIEALEISGSLMVIVSNCLIYVSGGVEPTYSLLALALTLTLRAALVPSTRRRTTAVGLLALGVYCGIIISVDGGFSVGMFWNTLIGGAFVVMTIVTSQVIYGLRREVQAAQHLGQYELKRKIGEGGMGVVYEATHVLLRRPTALKLLPVEKLGAQALARFEREVRCTSELEHPNSVYIYDYGHTPDGQFYYAMEYLEGFTLGELVELEGQVAPGRVREILLQTACALAEAHERGMVHRDIKPANIMICDRGRTPDMVKVLDFGLVKAMGESSEGLPGEEMSATLTDAVVGTAHFLAPETIRGEEVSAAADIYALGALAFYLLTGAHAFSGETIMAICTQHLTEPPPRPSALAEAPIPPALEALVLRMLAKDPKARPQDGAAVVEALEAIEAPRWTSSEARRWWATHHPITREISAVAPTQLAIDLGEREG